jgi:hypothetical protein
VGSFEAAVVRGTGGHIGMGAQVAVVPVVAIGTLTPG